MEVLMVCEFLNITNYELDVRLHLRNVPGVYYPVFCLEGSKFLLW